MKSLFLLVTLLFSGRVVSQDNKCDCIVKLTERELRLRNALKNTGASDYYKIKPKAGKQFSTHKVVKDSADSWLIKPYFNDVPETKTVSVKKSSQILCVVVQFNGADSIPLYSEASTGSKVIKYVLRSKFAQSESDKVKGFDPNDQWFAGCKPNWVKINIAGAASGWIKKENYQNK